MLKTENKPKMTNLKRMQDHLKIQIYVKAIKGRLCTAQMEECHGGQIRASPEHRRKTKCIT